MNNRLLNGARKGFVCRIVLYEDIYTEVFGGPYRTVSKCLSAISSHNFFALFFLYAKPVSQVIGLLQRREVHYPSHDKKNDFYEKSKRHC